MKLLERNGTLQDLARLREAAALGQGSLVALCGEAGVGKTSVLRAFLEGVPPDSQVRWGWCDPLSLPRPLGPVLDMALQGPESLARALEGDLDRNQLFAELLRLMRLSPWVLLFEDCHWADEATRDLLRFLGRRVAHTRSLVVITYRDDEVDATHPLRAVLGELATTGALHRLPLEPLSEASVRSLSQGTALDPADLHRRTGGNPFFVAEMIATGGEAVPLNLQEAVLARAARLNPEGRRALEAAAVMGSRLDPEQLAKVAGTTAEALDACLTTGVLIQAEHGMAFRHELGREAVLAGMPPGRRMEWHRRILELHRTQTPRADDFALLAHHAEAVGDREAVLAYAPAAAHRAATMKSHREAGDQYARALRFAGELPDRERAELLEARAFEGYLTNQIEAAVTARSEALALWKQLEAPEKVGETLRWLSRLNWFLGRRAEAEACAAEALAVLTSLPAGLQLALAQSNLSQLHMLEGRVAEAVTWGSRAIQLAEALGAKEALAHALNNVGTARAQAGDREGLPLLERSLALALELGLEEHAARAYTNLSSVAVATRRLEEGRHWLEVGLAYTRDHDLDSWTLYMSGWLCVCEFWQGHWDAAARLAEELLRHPRTATPSRIQPLVILGRIRVRRGDPQAAEVLDQALDLAQGMGELQRMGPVRAARAEAAWLAGDLALTRTEAEGAFALALELGDPWLVGELGVWLWRAGALADPPTGAAEPYALGMKGQALDSARAWASLGCPFEQALALWESAEPSAQREALALFEAVGARPLADRIARQLRAQGIRDLPRRPRASTLAHPAGLTTREVEVLRLVAQGLRNADIAERLFVSPKTVDHHVSALLGKLQARGRAELAARAAEWLGPMGNPSN